MDAVRVKVPDDGRRLEDYLLSRFPHAAEELDALFSTGTIVTDDGSPVHPDFPCSGGGVWYHRPLPEEPQLPQDLPVLYEDDHLLVVDKPHGLPSTPRGSFVTQTALTVLRHQRGEQDLAPAHRLDRDTAGVLLFTRDPSVRGRMQRQFQDRRTAKTYEAVVTWPKGVPLSQLPPTRSSRIHKAPGNLQAVEVDGPANAVTHFSPLRAQPWTIEGGRHHDDGQTWAALRLTPVTGQTHQLRVHLNAMGTPIRWDPLYPRILDRDPADVSHPLQLLARSLRIHHPVTGQPMEFTSGRALATLEQTPPPSQESPT